MMLSRRFSILMGLLSAALVFPTIVSEAVAQSASAPAEPEVAEQTNEQAFVACVYDRDRDLLYAIRDADSQDAFTAAIGKAYQLCEIAEDTSFSFAKLFKAIADKIGKPEYQD